MTTESKISVREVLRPMGGDENISRDCLAALLRLAVAANNHVTALHEDDCTCKLCAAVLAFTDWPEDT